MLLWYTDTMCREMKCPTDSAINSFFAEIPAHKFQEINEALSIQFREFIPFVSKTDTSGPIFNGNASLVRTRIAKCKDKEFTWSLTQTHYSNDIRQILKVLKFTFSILSSGEIKCGRVTRLVPFVDRSADGIISGIFKGSTLKNPLHTITLTELEEHCQIRLDDLLQYIDESTNNKHLIIQHPLYENLDILFLYDPVRVQLLLDASHEILQKQSLPTTPEAFIILYAFSELTIKSSIFPLIIRMLGMDIPF